MNLLTRTTIWYFISSLLIFSVGTIIFLNNLRTILDEEVNENLGFHKTELCEYFSKLDTLPLEWAPGTNIMKIFPSTEKVKEKFTDTLMLKKIEGEIIPYRLYQFNATVKNKNYSVTVAQTMIESEDLLHAIIISLVALFASLIILMLLINRWLSKKMWRGFYETLSKLKNFDLSKTSELNLPQEKIKEFKELNAALGKMTERISSDYKNMKEFTENASHELQTPLAIISSKLELLIQSPGFTEEQASDIKTCYESVNRLSKINAALLLLSKIENKQYNNEEKTNLSELLNNKLRSFLEMFAFKGMKIETEIVKNSSLKLPTALSEILLNNLLGNALKHGEKNGIISIHLTENKLSVCNPGKQLDISPKEIFKRFKKSGNSSDSHGLGLAIIKQICDSYNLKVNYSFAEGKHCFEIQF